MFSGAAEYLNPFSDRGIFRANLCGLFAAAILFVACPFCSPANSQNKPLAVSIAATELPCGAWGPYSRMHSGPCYLAQRFPFQLLSFPIIVGQRRVERIRQLKSAADSRGKLASDDMVLRRRVLGTSPTSGNQDDLAGTRQMNRRAVATEADYEGLLWTLEAHFAPSPLLQNAAPLPAPNGAPIRPAPWGAGRTRITWFPAFADNADGLLIRVELENNSTESQSWYIDQLEGIDTVTDKLSPVELVFDPQQESSSLAMRHQNLSTVFAAAVVNRDFPPTFHTVSSAYFAPEASQSHIERNGSSPPTGELAADTVPTAGPIPGRWGLMRLDDIVVAPGQKRVLWLCIGVGGDAGAAVSSARSLLRTAEGNPGAGIAGAYAAAQAAHLLAQSLPGTDALNRLLSQTLLCTPANGARRLGAPSRLMPEGAVYNPEFGALEALAWMDTRPERAAAQLNAWFSVLSNPDAPISKTHARPALDLFVLWQLHQLDTSPELLKRVYPFARKRYLELLAGCRLGDTGLYGWPSIDIARGDAGVKPGPPTRDCSATIGAEAGLLARIGQIVGVPDAEINQYRTEASAALDAMGKQDGSFNSGTDTADSLMPLLFGVNLPTASLETTLTRLKDTGKFLSPFGLRSVSKDSSRYHAGVANQGAISYKQNWQLFLSLLDIGRGEIAEEIADKLVRGYSAAASSQTDNPLPQWLDGDTGAGGGVSDWCGDSAALIWLNQRLVRPGGFASGARLELTERKYDAIQDTYTLAIRTFEPSPEGYTPVCVLCLGKPAGKYIVKGASTRTLTADAMGRIVVAGSAIPETLHIAISPASNGGNKSCTP